MFKPKPAPDPDYGQTEVDPEQGKKEPQVKPIEPPKPDGKVDTIQWTVKDPYEVPPEFKEDPLTGAIDIPVSKVLKNAYNVVVLMPFLTDRFAGPMSNLPSDALLAIEFYEGAKMALNQLELEGVNLNVRILDSRADTFHLKSLLELPDVLNADLIIGPVTRDNSRIIAEFGKLNRINVVSPYNPRSDIAEKNPFYIQVNPSTNRHFTHMMEFIHKRYPRQENILILAPEGSAGEARVEYLQEANKLILKDPNAAPLKEQWFKLEEGAQIDMKTMLVERDTNIVIIPSRDQAFVSFVLRELSLLRFQYPTIVFGMPQWKDFEKVDFTYFENLNVHLTSPSFVSRKDQRVLDLKRNYYNNYGGIADDNIYRGYDITLYFGRLLKEYGMYFQGYLEEAKDQYLHTGFHFEAIYENTGELREGQAIITQYENAFVNIVRFKNFAFERVNSARD